MRVARLLRGSVVVVSSVLVAEAYAGSLAFWDFENSTSAGMVSTSVALTTAPEISNAVISQDGGGPAEYLAGSTLFLTRYLGAYHPFVRFTTTKPVVLAGLRFTHYHNHNPGFPTYPSYFAQLQIDRGAGFVDIGSPVLLSPATGATEATVSLGNLIVDPGTYAIRWDPRGLAYGADTNTEFFAIDNVTLEGGTLAEVPTLSVWGAGLLALLVALAGAAVFRR